MIINNCDDKYDTDDHDVFWSHDDNEYHNEFWTNDHDDLCNPIDSNDML